MLLSGQGFPPVLSRRAVVLNAFAVAGLMLVPTVSRAADEDFASWLAGVRRDALDDGISQATLDLALADVAPIDRVIELDRQQPESALGFGEYVHKVVSPARIKAAQQHYRENRRLLAAVGHRYGVQPRYVVALWGIETDFGRFGGSFPVISALATLAYDGRRSAFFRGELMNALRIVDRDHVDPRTMRGSWAGAMGQSQFMPSSYLKFAVSYDGTAAPDIWKKPADVFASIANYLARNGWHGNETWGREVRLLHPIPPTDVGLGVRKPLAAWAGLGVRRADGSPLPHATVAASLIEPDGPDGMAVLAYDNFRAILKWNNSSSFATAVGYLADSLD